MKINHVVTLIALLGFMQAPALMGGTPGEYFYYRKLNEFSVTNNTVGVLLENLVAAYDAGLEGEEPARFNIMVDPSCSNRLITLTVREGTIGDVLRYVRESCRLSFYFEGNTIMACDVENEPMVTRFYPVMAGLFQVSTGRVADVTEDWKARGVPFRKGAFATYDAAQSILTVRNTRTDLELLERVLHVFDVIPHQVRIETALVEWLADRSPMPEDGPVDHQWLATNLMSRGSIRFRIVTSVVSGSVGTNAFDFATPRGNPDVRKGSFEAAYNPQVSPDGQTIRLKVGSRYRIEAGTGPLTESAIQTDMIIWDGMFTVNRLKFNLAMDQFDLYLVHRVILCDPAGLPLKRPSGDSSSAWMMSHTKLR